jgi:hypothetical protein
LLITSIAGFLKSPALQAFCKQYNTQTLPELHHSFSNMDRFSAILRKKRLLEYPAGQSYNGVFFEKERNPAIKVIIN